MALWINKLKWTIDRKLDKLNCKFFSKSSNRFQSEVSNIKSKWLYLILVNYIRYDWKKKWVSNNQLNDKLLAIIKNFLNWLKFH